jgi:glycosyltransferase involved in cell wall biosynthesis
MKALVIAPQPFFSSRGTPFSVYYRTLVTAELGVEVDLLTYGQGENVDVPGVRIIRIPNFSFLGPVKVGPSLLKAFLDVFMVIWTIALLLRTRYDFVHAHEESVFFCRFLKPFFRFQLVYDMHSSLPQQLINFKFSSSNGLIRAFTWLENTSLSKADAVITICPELEQYAVPLLPDPSRHFLIENSIFEDVLLESNNPREGTESEVVEGLSGSPIVLYCGTFEPYQGIDVLLRAFGEVRTREPKAVMVLAGGTPQQVEAMQELATSLGCADSCVFLGTVPPHQARNLLKKASIVVSPRVEGTNTPLKIYELLASGVPLVATRIPSHTQVLDDDVCFFVEPEPRSMAIGIVTAWRDPDLRARLVDSAQQLYEERYSRTTYESKIRRLLNLLAGFPDEAEGVPEAKTAEVAAATDRTSGVGAT